MATLLTLRVQLAQVTGRRGLDKDTVTCDRVLNRACRYLESLQDTPQSERRHFFKLANGTAGVAINGLRAVLSLSASDGTNTASLTAIDYSDYRAQGRISDLTNGMPTAYALAPCKLSNDQQAFTAADLLALGIDADSYADISFGPADGSTMLLVTPPSDGTWSLDLLGKFWPLTLNEPLAQLTNWWVANAPDTVCYAAAGWLSVERGNAASAKHWFDACKLGTNEVDVALAESEMAPWNAATDCHMNG